MPGIRVLSLMRWDILTVLEFNELRIGRKCLRTAKQQKLPATATVKVIN